MEQPCPHCGYCPHCKRALPHPQQWWYPTTTPYWLQPPYRITYGNNNAAQIPTSQVVH